MRWIWSAAVTLLVIGCSTENVSNSGEDGGCTSHYEPVADAPTEAALKAELLYQVNPRVRSLKVIDEDPVDDLVSINLLNRRNRVVMSLDVWRRDDGTWTAQRWSQCID